MTVAHVWMPDAATQVTVDAEVGGARRSEAEILADAQARIARLGGAEYLRTNPIGTGAPPPLVKPPAPPAAPPPPEPEPPRMTPEEIKRRLPSMYHQFLELAEVDITKKYAEVKKRISKRIEELGKGPADAPDKPAKK